MCQLVLAEAPASQLAVPEVPPKVHVGLPLLGTWSEHTQNESSFQEALKRAKCMFTLIVPDFTVRDEGAGEAGAVAPGALPESGSDVPRRRV
jgi:hypothetical protein